MKSVRIFFSVVIPFYNRAEFLEGLVWTLNAQTYQFYEVIFVDDCSDTSQSEALVEASKQLIAPVSIERLEVNCGAGFARGVGIKLANSEWIAFLDSDDIWSPLKLEWAATVLKNNPRCGILSHGFSLDETALCKENLNYFTDQVNRYHVLVRNISATPCLIIKKNTHVIYPRMRHNEDHAFLIKLAMNSELEIHQSRLQLCCLGKAPGQGEQSLSSNLTLMRVEIVKELSRLWFHYGAALAMVTGTILSMPMRHLLQLWRSR